MEPLQDSDSDVDLTGPVSLNPISIKSREERENPYDEDPRSDTFIIITVECRHVVKRFPCQQGILSIRTVRVNYLILCCYVSPPHEKGHNEKKKNMAIKNRTIVHRGYARP